MIKKIIWLSANKFGYELLKEARKIEKNNLIAIVTLSEKSKTKMYDGVDKDSWSEFGLDVYHIEDINNEKELFERLAPDLVVMCGWRQIIDEEILSIPKDGFIGFHPTLLPIGRGPAPIINTILEGFEESGVTMFYVSSGLDSGDIISQERFEVGGGDYASDVYDKVINAGKKLLGRELPLIIERKNKRTKQDESKATFFKKRSLKDNLINENDGLDLIKRKIRAFSKPYKGAYVIKDDKKEILWRIEDLK